MKNNLKLRDLPINERPRERLLRYGCESLSNVELLAIILRTGSKKENVLSLCGNIMEISKGLNGILELSREELMQIDGIGEAKLCQLLALSELFKRFKSFKSGDNYQITKPQDAAFLVMEEMRYLKQEYIKVIMLNTKNGVVKVKDIFIGSLNSSIVHPREIFCEAIKNNSSSIIICHNHPSGDPMPSNEDIDITKRIVECGNIIGIELLDHIIIGDGVYISLKEKGMV
ncbi:DNA repair protein RadC [Clostridium sp. MSJ-11]|uniref:DNA repair protein RadC n=1 Tax=Clostridium mobile TaxID=2841512 RepID=A0ABS6EEE2_9CLOT|nr:DNA repair protein RadC [Clostridium mobile]MBU5483573.1 DNA repair protein RadC [Clostridium mobile]